MKLSELSLDDLLQEAQRLKGENDALKATEQIRYRAEASRKEAQRVAHIGAWEYDPHSGHVWWSDGMYALFGLDVHCPAPHWDDFLQYIDESDRPTLEQALVKVLKTEESIDIDIQINSNDEQKKWIHFRAAMIFAENGQAPKLIGNVHDISARKQAEEQLRESAHHNESLLRLRQQLEVARDYEDVISALHEEIQTVLGYKACWLYLYSKDRKELRMVATKGRDKRSELEHLQHIDPTRDSFAKALSEVQNLWVIPDARTHPLTDKEAVKLTGNRVVVNMPIRILGRSLGVVGAGTFWEEPAILPTPAQRIFWEQLAYHTASALDRIQYYRELHETQDELRLAKARLEKTVDQRTTQLADLDEAMKHFAYMVSHDLQEPLRMVISYVQLLEKRSKNKLEGTEQEFLNYVLDGAFRMKDLLDGILAYSRLTTRAQLHETVDLNEVVETITNNLQIELRQSEGNIESISLPTVMGEPNQLISLFYQLIDNSIKFSGGKPPKIQIGMTETDEGQTFFVKDQGIGFEEKDAKRIFNMFQRLHPRTKFSGNGVGLALCARIVQLHQGKIWAESTPGEGSTFYFTLKSE